MKRFAMLVLTLAVITLCSSSGLEGVTALNNYKAPSSGGGSVCDLAAYGNLNTIVWACYTAGSYPNAAYFCTVDESFCWLAGDDPCPAGGPALGCY